MNRIDYTQGVVRTRVLEKELLSNAKFEQMIEAEDAQALWQMLKTTHYANYMKDDLTVDQFEYVLHRCLIDTYETIREFAVDENIINLLALQYDYFNLKVLLKETILNVDLSHLYSPLSTVSLQHLKQYIQKKELSEVDEHIKRTIEIVLTDYEKTKDPQRIELMLDKLYMNNFYERIHLLHIPLLLQYVKAMIDFINIRTVIRVQKQNKDISFLREILLDNGNIECEEIIYSFHDSVMNMIRKFRHEEISRHLIKGLEEYKRTERLTTFEKEMDNYLLKLIDEAKYIHFGPEPLIAYVLKKEAEIKNLRIIFVSKLNDIPLNRIKQRVRDIYV